MRAISAVGHGVVAACLGALLGLLVGCGPQPGPVVELLAPAYPEGQLVDEAGSFAISLSNVTHDGKWADGDCQVSVHRCKIAGPASSGRAALLLIVKGYKPVVISAEYAEGRIVGVANGSGFVNASVALASGDSSWIHWEARTAAGGGREHVPDPSGLPDLLPALLPGYLP